MSRYPARVIMDEFVCPLDIDGDGIPDYLDKCPNTSKGVKVDKNGCPLDSDGDGVPDYLDICSDTPHGVKVDDLGCPFDMDGDGVPDYLDKCPNTPHGMKVDLDGCPIIKKKVMKPDNQEVNEVILSAGTNFGLGKTEILPTAYPELNKLVASMQKNPFSRWTIEGYTDNSGSNKKNLKISLERAQSVVNYFVSKGIPRNRFKVYGKGNTNPIASNNTETGRTKNRRVVIKEMN